MTPETPDPWLTSAEVEQQYRIPESTLCVWRSRGIGPKFRRLGRAIHYRQSDVDAYVQAQMVSTSDQAAS